MHACACARSRSGLTVQVLSFVRETAFARARLQRGWARGRGSEHPPLQVPLSRRVHNPTCQRNILVIRACAFWRIRTQLPSRIRGLGPRARKATPPGGGFQHRGGSSQLRPVKHSPASLQLRAALRGSERGVCATDSWRRTSSTPSCWRTPWSCTPSSYFSAWPSGAVCAPVGAPHIFADSDDTCWVFHHV